jgi:hypothetical protein
MKPIDVMRARALRASGRFGAHAYWRVKISAAQGGVYTSLDRVQMRLFVGDVDAASGGVAIADSFYSAEYEPAKAFDVSASTTWASAGTALPHWIGYQFATPVAIAEIAITSNNATYNAPDEDPKDFTLEYSDDGVAWTVAATVTNQTAWARSQTRSFTL